MKKLYLSISFFFCVMLSFAQNYVDVQELEILGRAFDHTEGLYGRLPVDMKDEYRPELWSLGANSAGVAGIELNTTDADPLPPCVELLLAWVSAL